MLLTVAIALLKESLVPLTVGSYPDWIGIILGTVVIIFITSCFDIVFMKNKRIVIGINIVSAVLLIIVSAIFGFTGYSLAISAQCGTGAGIGNLAVIVSLATVLGVFLAELHYFNRKLKK